jgi:hypothetical protein
MVTPEQLSAYLIVLRDAGIARATLDGIGSVEFTAPEQPDAEVRYVEVTPPTVSAPQAPTDPYTRLFGGTAPKFKPVEG